MTRIAYYERQILQAIPLLGKEGEDAERLRLLSRLFRDNSKASMADCMAVVFPDKTGKAAVDAFKAFRGRIEKAGREGRPPFELIFVYDKNKRRGADRRFCWIEGPPMEPVFRSLVDDVRDLADLPNPASLGMPKIRLMPLFRKHDNVNALKLRSLLEVNLKSHQTIEFQLVDSVDQAELLLPLLSPAFFADTDLLERVRGWSLEKPAIPVGLEPFADIQSDGSFDHVRQFLLSTQSGRSLRFSECRGRNQESVFALDLFRSIDDFVKNAFMKGMWKTGLDWLGAWSEGLAHLEGDSIVENPAKRMRMNDTTASARPAQYASDGDAKDLLRDWAVRRGGAHYLAVLGEYGIGKTTSLKRFTLDLQERRKTDSSLPVPIYLDLRDGAEGTAPDATLEVILRRILDKTVMDGPKTTPSLVLDAVQKFGAVLIFDGLDERTVHMTARQAEGFTRELLKSLPPALLKKNADATGNVALRPGKLIVSCRSHYFRTLEQQMQMLTGFQRGGFRNDDCDALIVLPFREEQIRSYVDKALKLNGKQSERIDHVMQLFATIHNLSEMAPRPVLLKMLMEQIEDLEEMQARSGRPISPVDIYEQIAQKWLERDSGKHKLSPDHKLRIMEGLAAFLWKEGLKQVDVAQLDSWFILFLARNEDIRSRVEFDKLSADILEGDLRTSTFIVRPETEAKQFRFAHTSFQEYFLARYLVRALSDCKAECWSLPEVSKETLDFLGQMLRQESNGTILETLSLILGRNDSKATILAFNYWLLAIEKGYPQPTPAFVDLSGVDLDERTIQGRSPLLPLNLRGAKLIGCTLNRSRLTDIDLAGADLSASEARNAIFERVHAPQIEAKLAKWSGLQWRGGSLVRAKLSKTDLSSAMFNTDLTDAEMPRRWDRYAVSTTSYRPKVDENQANAWVVLVDGHTDNVRSCAFSPDGSRIVSASSDHTLKIWDAASGRIIRSLEGHSDRVRSCAFSPDGSRIVSASSDHTLKIWDAATGRIIRSLEGHTDTVRSCAFSPDGSRIVSVSFDGNVKLWDTVRGRSYTLSGGTNRKLSYCTFSPDGTHILAISSYENSYAIDIWDRENGLHEETLENDFISINSCTYHPDGSTIVATCADSTLHVWETADSHLQRSFGANWGCKSTCAFSPDGTRLISASLDNVLRIWEVASGRCLRLLNGHKDAVLGCAFSPDGTYLVSASRDRTLRIWDGASGRPLRSLDGHRDAVLGCAFSPDGTHLLSSSQDGTLRVWDISSGRHLRTIEIQKDGALACGYSPDGARIVCTSPGGILRVWNATNGQYIRSVEGVSFAFCPNGTRLVTTSRDGTLNVSDAVGGGLLHTLDGHKDAILGCAFSPDGKRLISASRDRTLRLWDATTGRLLRSLDGHRDAVLGCAFSPDGTHLVSSSQDGSLRVWSATGYKLLCVLRHLPAGAYASFDGKNNLIACSENAWPYLARRWYDRKAKRERLLPAEFFGPLPITSPEE
jgi:WD40 repeat protein